MSILGKDWHIKNTDSSQNIIEKLLANRGLNNKDLIQSYLYPSYKKGFHNPFLMKNMEKAVGRIKKAVENQEKIMIFGDYDVDGISGTAILFKTLKLLGARISYRLPHRVKDGYGLSNAFIEEFSGIDVKLLVTVDCGISCKNQIALAKTYGMDVIITDHHTIPEHFPDDAYAVLHPLQPACDYPFKGLTGAGVAYKLASALLTDRFAGEERDQYLFSLLDLASLGTVADIGPIQDENRIIVKYGLEALKNTKWSGLRHLMKQAGINTEDKLDINTIGFRISPRINAAGRIDHPYFALQLLLHEEENEKSLLLAQHLEKLNQNRQLMVQKAIEEAEEQVAKNRDSSKIFIAWSPDWHVGILGLIAGKLVEKHLHPCIILQDFGDYLVASARGPESFNIIEALTANATHLEHFGGHAQAAGFNIKKEKLFAFKEAITAYAEQKLARHEFRDHLHIDCELEAQDVNSNLLNFLEQMEPFGVGNEQPLFVARNVRALFPRRVGKEQNHLQFRTQIGTGQFSAIGFKLGQHEQILQSAPAIDLAFHLEKNTWKGVERVQLRAVDFKAAS